MADFNCNLTYNGYRYKRICNQAAIYGGRAKLKTLLIDKGEVGGLVNTTREIVNYPGYTQISGPDLMKEFKKHAETFGMEFLKGEVVRTDFSQEEKKVVLKKARELLQQRKKSC